MKYRTLVTQVCIVIAVASVNVKASELLRHNPFEEPDFSSDMSRAGASKALRNEMKLRGTVVDGMDSLVNIDGKFYRINQEVAGYRVIRIERTSVTLRRADNETVLTLNEDE